jgi:hypothetical protein
MLHRTQALKVSRDQTLRTLTSFPSEVFVLQLWIGFICAKACASPCTVSLINIPFNCILIVLAIAWSDFDDETADNVIFEEPLQLRLFLFSSFNVISSACTPPCVSDLSMGYFYPHNP